MLAALPTQYPCKSIQLQQHQPTRMLCRRTGVKIRHGAAVPSPSGLNRHSVQIHQPFRRRILLPQGTSQCAQTCSDHMFASLYFRILESLFFFLKRRYWNHFTEQVLLYYTACHCFRPKLLLHLVNYMPALSGGKIEATQASAFRNLGAVFSIFYRKNSNRVSNRNFCTAYKYNTPGPFSIVPSGEKREGNSYTSGPDAKRLTRPRKAWTDTSQAWRSSPSKFQTLSSCDDIKVNACVCGNRKIMLRYNNMKVKWRKKRKENDTLWCSTNLKLRGSEPFLVNCVRCLQISQNS